MDETTPRTRAPEQTRRAILDAAIAEFSEKGFAGGRWTTSPRAPPPPSG